MSLTDPCRSYAGLECDPRTGRSAPLCADASELFANRSPNRSSRQRSYAKLPRSGIVWNRRRILIPSLHGNVLIPRRDLNSSRVVSLTLWHAKPTDLTLVGA